MRRICEEWRNGSIEINRWTDFESIGAGEKEKQGYYYSISFFFFFFLSKQNLIRKFCWMGFQGISNKELFLSSNLKKLILF